jgi:hypothetical protein
MFRVARSGLSIWTAGRRLRLVRGGCRLAWAHVWAHGTETRARLTEISGLFVGKVPIGREKTSLRILAKLLVFWKEWAGGERGIRTLGRVSPTHAFQACTISLSVISPRREVLPDDCNTPRDLLRQATDGRPVESRARTELARRASPYAFFFRIRHASGGSVSCSRCGWPCATIGCDGTAPAFPWFDPP